MEADGYSIKQFIKTIASSILLLLAIAFFSCAPNKPEEIQALASGAEYPSLTVQDLTTVITDSGKLKYRFVTPRMLQFDQKEEPTIEFPSGLHLFVFDDNQQVDAQIKCKKAIFYKNEELWELRNDVEAVNVKGDVLNTELLYWDQKKKIIHSNEFVKITRENQISTGYGLESDDRLVNFKIKNFSGDYEIKE
jgi:LPS export ABC transporter protein LptC